MSLVAVEGFDHLSASDFAVKQNRAIDLNLGSFVSGRFSPGSAARVSNGSSAHTSFVDIVLPSAYATVVMGSAVKFENSNDGVGAMRTAGGVNIAYWLWNGTHMQIYDVSNTLVATGTATLSAGVWHYIELKLFINGASGTCELHVDGVSDIASTVHNFGSTNIGAVRHQVSGSSVGLSFDDIYVNNDGTFYGDMRVETLWPSGAGAHTQWTPDSGSNYARVNEHTADGDTSYVFDPSSGDRDSYAFDNLTELTGTIQGLQTNLFARKDASGVKQICAVARPGSTDRDGATVTLASSYVGYTEIRDTNPDTSAAWTIGDVNASEFGIKVI